MPTVREKVALLLQPNRYEHKLSGYVDVFLIVLICLNVIEVILDSVESFHREYAEQLLWFEYFSIAIFTLEYLLRIWTCIDLDESDSRPYLKQRLAYICTPMALIDLLAIIPFYLSLFVSLDLRFLRVVRILRVFKLTRYSVAMQLLLQVFKDEQRSFVAAFSILFTLLIIAASGIYVIEHEVQPDKFGSIPEAMWWAMATLTTVGYGDVTPITPGGKFFGGLITIVSMGMVALPTGILASGFNMQMKRRQQKFTVLLKQILRDGIVTEQEWADLEVLRKELDLDKEEAELIIQLSEARKQNMPECPHCGEVLHPARREEDQ